MRKFWRLLVLVLIAIPVLGLLALGKILFKNGESKYGGLSLINKAQADIPGNCGAGNCGLGGGNSGSSGGACGACQSDDCCGGNGKSGDGTTCSTGSFGGSPGGGPGGMADVGGPAGMAGGEPGGEGGGAGGGGGSCGK